MSVKLRDSKQVVARYREKRRGRRMNSRVPVRLEWENGGGKRISVEAHTRIVNPYGCMVVLQQELALEHRLALTNLATTTATPRVSVGKAVPPPDGWEYGVELVAPEMDFWGIEL